MKIIKSFVILILIMHISVIQAQYLPLYDKIPNYIETPNEESAEVRGVYMISKVSVPGYAFFSAGEEGDAKPCVVICPGGGYGILASEHEGTDVAKYFNSIGVHAVVLKYRIPSSSHQMDPKYAPLQDAQQMMHLVRKNAKQWNVDPAKVGIMGFSAGGHLASSLATHYDDKKIKSRNSLRPDFQILIYPVISFGQYTHMGSRNNLLGKDTTSQYIGYFSNELHITANSPKAFLVHAKNDEAVPIENAWMYKSALEKSGVSVQLIEFEKGGHGFGMINSTSEIAWPTLLTKWLKKEKIL
jgi:acetyl esterase/lipase